MKIFLKKSFIVGLMSLFVAVGLVYSQAMTGKIIGTVSDDRGVPLPGVSVEVSSPNLMGTRSDVTSVNGIYRFINLPPGFYVVKFELSAFGPVERQNIRVTLGGTATVDAEMTPSALSVEVTVISTAPVVDVEKTGVTTAFDADDLELLPTGRSGISSQLDYVAGFQSESSFGSDGTDNNYTLNGLPISSPESGEFRMNPDIEMVEEVEVVAIGASAEYGQATGAVVNVVTKSGGNKFSGMVGLYLQPDALIGDNNPSAEFGEDWQSVIHNKWYDASIMLSGAVAQDKVWFFGYWNKRKMNIVRFRGDPEWPRKSVKYAAEFKLTGQIGTRHRVSGNYFWLYSGNPMKEPSDIVATECAAFHYFSKPSHFGYWDWQMSRNSLFSVKIGYWANPEREGDPVPEFGSSLYRAPHFDEQTGRLSNATDFFLMWMNARFQWNTTLSHYAEDFLGANHDLKIGVQYDKGQSHPAGGYPGGAYYLDQDGQPWRVYQQEPHHFGGEVQGIGLFVDDKLKIGNRLTVNAGIRFDYNKGSIPEWPMMDGPDDIATTAPGLANAVDWKVFSPRFGFSYELTPDHKTLLRGFWGIFHPMPHGTKFGAPGPGIRDTIKYQYIGPPVTVPYYTLVDGAPWNIYTTNPQVDPANWFLYDQISGDAGYTMDPDLKNPVSSQFTIGIDREIMRDFAIGFSFVYKKEWNLIGLEDRGIGDEPGPEYELVAMTSPDAVAAGYDADHTWDVWNLVGGTHYIVQTNPDNYYLKYRSFIFTFNKRYSNNWLLQGSIQWQRGVGLNMASGESGNNQEFWNNNFGIDPNDTINRDGRLPFLRDWFVKLRAAYTMPYGINLGANFSFARGELYGREIDIDGLNQGSRRIRAETLGDYRHQDEFQVDLRAEKVFKIDTVRLHLIVDVFNVTNSYVASVARNRSSAFSSVWVGSSAYLSPSDITNPRLAQIGVKIVF